MPALFSSTTCSATERCGGEWRAVYETGVAHYEQAANGNAVAGRMAVHFSAIALTAAKVHRALTMPWARPNPVSLLLEELTSESGEADRAAAALRHAHSWAVAHRASFYHAGKSDWEQPPGGWAGRWDAAGVVGPTAGGQREAGTWIGFLPHVLSRLLEEGRYEPASAVRLWKDRGWLITDGGASQRNTLSTHLGQQRVRVIAVSGQAVQEVLGD
jgi:hypothetical protein